jgi:hypothetical protein
MIKPKVKTYRVAKIKKTWGFMFPGHLADVGELYAVRETKTGLVFTRDESGAYLFYRGLKRADGTYRNGYFIVDTDRFAPGDKYTVERVDDRVVITKVEK